MAYNSWNKVKTRARQYCIGSLNHKIKIHSRTIKAPTIDSDFGETITEITEVWASINTLKKGVDIFDGVNLVGTVTHEVAIRYRANMTTENYIEYNSEYYKILSVENINQNNDTLVLKCALRGDTSYGANKA